MNLTISTLLYCFNTRGEVLLLQRNNPPNRGLWSPPGGKLHTASGESPYMCACREAKEELGLDLRPADLHLTGLISESNYEQAGHWLMFLFEVKKPVDRLPPAGAEGRFGFFSWDRLWELPLPDTDRDQIWPLFCRHRGGFFAAHCRRLTDSQYEWIIEESVPPVCHAPLS